MSKHNTARKPANVAPDNGETKTDLDAELTELAEMIEDANKGASPADLAPEDSRE
jgi:hypothetical protein